MAVDPEDCLPAGVEASVAPFQPVTTAPTGGKLQPVAAVRYVSQQTWRTYPCSTWACVMRRTCAASVIGLTTRQSSPGIPTVFPLGSAPLSNQPDLLRRFGRFSPCPSCSEFEASCCLVERRAAVMLNAITCGGGVSGAKPAVECSDCHQRTDECDKRCHRRVFTRETDE